MKRYNCTLAVCFVLVAVLLAGCNSSSYNSGSGTTSNVKGVFADAPVMGVSYTCGTTSGTTGAGGSYSCPYGSTSVTFSVGAVTLCSAAPQAFMTLVSCAQATNPSANTSTPSVLALAQFLISISTTPASSGGLTITSAELTAAANLSLNPTTATQAQLQTAVTAVDPGATLVTPAVAQTELNGTVTGGAAGSYSGSFTGNAGDSGTFTVTVASTGTVSGTFTDTKNSQTGTISGALVNGTEYSGTAGSSTWTGSVNTAVTPNTFSGTWSNSGSSGTETGTFTGHE